MSLSNEASTAADANGEPIRTVFRRPQFTLLTLMLLVMTVASWTAAWQTRKQTARLEARLPGLREIARDLRVEDPSQYAVVRHHELWHDDFRWRIYLPPGHRYRLHLASKLVDQRDLAEATRETAIPAGEHELELQYERVDGEWQIAVLVDGEELLHETQPDEWNIGRGSSGGSNYESSTQRPLNQPLDLFRRQFMVLTPGSTPTRSSSTTPKRPSDGILLWIESTPPAERLNADEDDIADE